VKIESYEDLEIWQLGMDLLVQVYRLADSLPVRERYNLTDQMCRAALSVPSNIAEGWGRGRGASQAHFIRIARASLYELATQLEAGRRIGYFSEALSGEMKELIEVLGKKMNSYLSWLEKQFVREERSPYGAGEELPI
jgi:four helix bundle protein